MPPQLSLLNFPYKVAEVAAVGRIPDSSGRQTVTTALQAIDIVELCGRLHTRPKGGEKQHGQKGDKCKD